VVNDFDELFGQSMTERNLKLLQERMAKMIQNNVKKAAKKSAQTHDSMAHCLSQVEDLKVQIEANKKKRKTLATMCQMLLSKNTELYLKHELMLEEERKKRADLGVSFQQ
jgi:predicted porin